MRALGVVGLGVVFLASLMCQAGAAEPGFPIRDLKMTGDSSVLEQEGLLENFRSALIGKTVTPVEIQEQARLLRDQLRDRGYVMASVRTSPSDYSTGIIPIDVDIGRFGKTTFNQSGGGPYKARWFSEEQLRYRLSGMAEGAPFNESLFYQHVLGVNTHPDLVLDPALSGRREVEDDRTVRYADLAFAVTESRPLHAVFTVDNAGADSTGEWQASALVQYLNLTRHDDILSLWLGPVSEDGGSSQSAAASYMRPRLSGRGGASLFYGGYSDVESQEVEGLFTLRGKGWFVGFREDWRLVANSTREVIFSAGAAWRSQEETLSVESQNIDGDTKDVSVLPLSVGIRVTPLRYDALGGRTFLEAEAVCGPGGLTGSDEDIEAFRPGAEETYLIGRARAARLQPLAKQARERAGEAWLLMGRVEAQVANGALLGAEQLALGGMDTVRGFEENAIMGDQGGDATLELRSPLTLLGARHHLQGVLFLDAGHVMSEGDDDMDAVTLAGAGGGIRLALGAHAQLRLDYGIPVAGADDIEDQTGMEVDSGRAHIRATVQF